MMPCPNRDHHADFYRMLTEHEPEPAYANAADALGDLDYHRGLADYDEDLGTLMDPSGRIITGARSTRRGHPNRIRR